MEDSVLKNASTLYLVGYTVQKASKQAALLGQQRHLMQEFLLAQAECSLIRCYVGVTCLIYLLTLLVLTALFASFLLATYLMITWGTYAPQIAFSSSQEPSSGRQNIQTDRLQDRPSIHTFGHRALRPKQPWARNPNNMYRLYPYIHTVHEMPQASKQHI